MSYRIKHKFVSITACILSSICSVAIRKYFHSSFFCFWIHFSYLALEILGLGLGLLC